MKIDFHSHVKISKNSMFMPEYFSEMVKEASDAGLDALAMTEHFNTRKFQDIYDYLDEHYAYVDGYYNVEGLKLFPGMEVDVKEVGHILIIGDKNEILAIRNRLDSHTEKEHFIQFADLMDIADEYNVLRIGAHPFRESTPLHHIDKEQLKRLDALDLNGKDLYSYSNEAYVEKLTSFAESLELPIVGGSDTHQFLQYGCIYNTFETNCNDVDELKRMITNGGYHTVISPNLHLKVKSATLVKKLIKNTINQEGYATIYAS
ncbi:PHP domain-containing protein [Oceanobacillus piezotolerans]|uniref:PHP domain-containing protein n=1 Tax=Oceanobacillus piezotolerans TaxID=2448030 RepID=A0A498D6P4_9BACI|nr:PHP-associated domain-containing protein [Oceanobacillus piezotolerans]RLL43684.1 PHP domain-containing protein [Oceanobacillus piezotolerans]